MSSHTDHDPVGISAGDVLLSEVVVGSGEYGAGTEQSNAEVSFLRCISISDEPVRTEPGAAGAAVQSYTTAWTASISVSH